MTSNRNPNRPDPTEIERGGYTGSDKKKTGVKRPHNTGDTQDPNPHADTPAQSPQD